MRKNCKQFNTDFKSTILELFEKWPLFSLIVDKIAMNGGRVYLVGGAVRDILLGESPHDLDCQVHGIHLEQLRDLLGTCGRVDFVGKSFGVLRLFELPVDWSLPRTDSSGRKPLVIIDEKMDVAASFARRDLTINAMGVDLHSYELVDPFDGLDDLRNGILRAPDIDLFIEDPLRLFRVMYFAAKFAFAVDERLHEACRAMPIAGLSKERIGTEFDKLFLKTHSPSLGIRWLREIGRLKEILPELDATFYIQQNPLYHPEGNVFEHTMQAIDHAAQQHYTTIHERLLIMYTVLFHDLGKVTTTFCERGIIHSYGHEKEGARLAPQALARISARRDLLPALTTLIRYHLRLGQLVKQGGKDGAYKQLAWHLHPSANLHLLSLLARADLSGRNVDTAYKKQEIEAIISEFVARARQLGVLFGKEEPALTGRDLLGIVGEGPCMGELLRRAYIMQITQGIRDKTLLKKMVLESRCKVG